MKFESSAMRNRMKTQVKRSQREWLIAALGGLLALISAALLVRGALGLNMRQSVYFLLAPVVVSIFLKSKVESVARQVDRTLLDRYPDAPRPAKYAERHALLLLATNPDCASLARAYRIFSLYWAASSLYVLGIMVMIALSFLINGGKS